MICDKLILQSGADMHSFRDEQFESNKKTAKQTEIQKTTGALQFPAKITINKKSKKGKQDHVRRIARPATQNL